MQIFLKRWWKKVLLVLLVLTLLREVGILGLNWYSSEAASNSSTTTTRMAGAIAVFDPEEIEVVVRPSMLDYVPFFKMRTFSGKVEVAKSGVQISMTYEIRLRVLGLCSGYHFRKQVRDRVIATIQDRAAK